MQSNSVAFLIEIRYRWYSKKSQLLVLRSSKIWHQQIAGPQFSFFWRLIFATDSINFQFSYRRSLTVILIIFQHNKINIHTLYLLYGLLRYFITLYYKKSRHYHLLPTCYLVSNTSSLFLTRRICNLLTSVISLLTNIIERVSSVR